MLASTEVIVIIGVEIVGKRLPVERTGVEEPIEEGEEGVRVGVLFPVGPLDSDCIDDRELLGANEERCVDSPAFEELSTGGSVVVGSSEVT